MKYKCDLIQDLMPLCTDDSASEGSKKAVFEHMAECKTCSEYYQKLMQNVEMETEDVYKRQHQRHPSQHLSVIPVKQVYAFIPQLHSPLKSCGQVIPGC